MFTKCSNLESRHLGESYFRQFNCPEGQYNELATLLLNPLGAKGITLLFTEGDADAFCLTTCLVAGCVEFFILIVAFGMSVSAGIFIPLLFAGACFGRALALFLNNSVFDDIYLDPRTYAIIGSASTLGGVARVLISLTSIVTHTVSLSFFMTPVMVACLFSQEVGKSFLKTFIYFCHDPRSISLFHFLHLISYPYTFYRQLCQRYARNL